MYILAALWSATIPLQSNSASFSNEGRVQMSIDFICSLEESLLPRPLKLFLTISVVSEGRKEGRKDEIIFSLRLSIIKCRTDFVWGEAHVSNRLIPYDIFAHFRKVANNWGFIAFALAGPGALERLVGSPIRETLESRFRDTACWKLWDRESHEADCRKYRHFNVEVNNFSHPFSFTKWLSISHLLEGKRNFTLSHRASHELYRKSRESKMHLLHTDEVAWGIQSTFESFSPLAHLESEMTCPMRNSRPAVRRQTKQSGAREVESMQRGTSGTKRLTSLNEMFSAFWSLRATFKPYKRVHSLSESHPVHVLNCTRTQALLFEDIARSIIQNVDHMLSAISPVCNCAKYTSSISPKAESVSDLGYEN